MKPIDQTRFGEPEGNCWAACVASILEVPIETFTFETPLDHNWSRPWHEWLAGHGLAMLWFVVGQGVPPPGYSILSGKSPRGIMHSVVALNGVVVHDPHPSRAGIIEGTEADWHVIYRPLVWGFAP